MKRLLSGFVAAALAVPAVLSAAAFEGKVSFKITPPKGEPQEIAYSIKGDKQRIEMPQMASSGMGGMIADTTKREMTILIDSQHMYMVQPMPDAAAAPQGDKAPPQGNLEKTGQKEKILGYDAEKFVTTSADGAKTELWLAEGLGTFVPFGGGGPGGRGRGGPPGMGGGRGGPGGQAWAGALAGKELFPLRVVSHDKDGAEFRMEVTKIDKQSLSDSLFAPPADYQKFDMGGMMRGAMPGMPGMRLPGR